MVEIIGFFPFTWWKHFDTVDMFFKNTSWIFRVLSCEELKRNNPVHRETLSLTQCSYFKRQYSFKFYNFVENLYINISSQNTLHNILLHFS